MNECIASHMCRLCSPTAGGCRALYVQLRAKTDFLLQASAARSKQDISKIAPRGRNDYTSCSENELTSTTPSGPASQRCLVVMARQTADKVHAHKSRCSRDRFPLETRFVAKKAVGPNSRSASPPFPPFVSSCRRC